MMVSTLTLRRPVAVAMFFLGIVLIGIVGWQRMPVELFPTLQGNELYVSFGRPGSEPEVLEREILLPLQAGVSGLPHVIETFGQIRGSSGNFRVVFKPGSEIKVRQLELQRLASTLQREQPRDAYIAVSSQDTSMISSFAMMVHVVGGDADDINALHDLVEDRVAPRLASVPGVSQAFATGGAPRQVNVLVDSNRAAALGITTDSITNAIRKNADHIRFLGQLESEDGRTAIMLDGRTPGIDSMDNIRIRDDRPVRLEHIGHTEFGTARERRLFRVNGKPAIGLVVFQEQGANVVRLGESLRERLLEIGEELEPLGLQFVIGFDAAETVAEQISHLGTLGLSGYAIALIVLFVFLRQWRSVAVVGVAVPVSLLAALSLLFVLGQSLNLITLFGLALAVGLVVDNSVVVYEAIQRGLERGIGTESAVRQGLNRTVRAIIAASATTAVVFLPLVFVEFEDEFTRGLVEVVTLAILLPLAASLVVAIGLVPLLAHRLAAPAALKKFQKETQRRKARGFLIPPQPGRIFFGGVVANAIRHPSSWLAGTIAAVFVTVIVALPWVLINTSQQEQETDTVEMTIRFSSRGSLENNSVVMAELERAVLDLDGIELVEAQIEEDMGTLTVHLVDFDERPTHVNSSTVRKTVWSVAKQTKAEVLRRGEEVQGAKGGDRGRGGGGFNSMPSQIVLSGPESAELERLAQSVQIQLETVAEVEQAFLAVQPGMRELWVQPFVRTFESLGLTFDSVLAAFALAGREGERMQTGFILPNGRELPLVVERAGARNEINGRAELSRLRIHTEAGAIPVASLTAIRKMPPPPIIMHHNGRREMSVFYRLSGDVPQTGPSRIAIEERIQEAVRAIPRPRGYAMETVEADETTSWFNQVLLPIVLLLFLVLAITFESLTMPVLVLIALPLTLLGATWALAVAGMPLSIMAIMGALALIGLTVNPAILLVDRMQQLVLISKWTAGAAAFAAVRERTRPILMTTATTIAALWPLALETGRENEIWPPFATIVIGGLITSSILTLLMIPVGFVLMRRLDEIFARVSSWIVLIWLTSTVVTVTVLVLSGLLVSLLWQVISSILIGSVLLGIVVFAIRPRRVVEPNSSDGPPALEVRFLRKVYGLPGPLHRALAASGEFAERVVAAKVVNFDKTQVREGLFPLGLAILGVAYMSANVVSIFWSLSFAMVGAALFARFIMEIRRSRGFVDPAGRVASGGIENWIAAFVPWVVLGCSALLISFSRLAKYENGSSPMPSLASVLFLSVLIGTLLLAFQAARRNAKQQITGNLPGRVVTGKLRAARNIWRRVSVNLVGLDLPRKSFTALDGVSFTAENGMIGILGPNGAGKSTLLRQLAGVLNPTRGAIHLGGVSYDQLRNHLSRWVGYLPQDAGIPGGLTPQEYLDYYAALYEIDSALRGQRVADLLEEVGLSDKKDVPVQSLSGGMRQRVAVARTLLRLPSVIVVDEPTVGLDPRERIRFRNLLSRMATKRIVLFSTHVVDDVAVACKRVLVLNRGKLVYDGEPSSLSVRAKGSVWQVRMPEGQPLDLPDNAILASESPHADGTVAYRILCTEPPHPDAENIESSLEDGYIWLINKDIKDS
jgi:multidrug efflux pump subunit AcrB/ABC-type multidrug transport system ATPase subunit